MNTEELVRLRRANDALRAFLVSMVEQVDIVTTLIDELAYAPPDSSSRTNPAAPTLPLSIDRARLAVTWRDRSCVLGTSKGFLILERLARRPGAYIPDDVLIDEAWGGVRTYSTLRSEICRLRRRLRRGGLAELAARIDGGMHGHYRLAED